MHFNIRVLSVSGSLVRTGHAQLRVLRFPVNVITPKPLLLSSPIITQQLYQKVGVCALGTGVVVDTCFTAQPYLVPTAWSSTNYYWLGIPQVDT
jgi:hypothetical protein